MRASTHGQSTVWEASGGHCHRRIRGDGRLRNLSLVEGNTRRFLINGISALAALVFSFFVITYIIASIIDRTMGLRVTEEEEYVGLDISQHGERG